MQKKLKLNDLNVESFKINENNIKGGTGFEETGPIGTYDINCPGTGAIKCPLTVFIVR